MTITVLNKQSRLGTYETNSVVIPSNPPDILVVTILIDLVDKEDPSTHITMTAEVSTDNGSTWQSIGGGVWDGGPQNPKNNATPTWSFTTDHLANHIGKQLRGVLTVDPRLSVGVSVTV